MASNITHSKATMNWKILMLFAIVLKFSHCEAYKPTCPSEITGCSISNMCAECANPLCEYCQNINDNVCGEFDCMTCFDGYTLFEAFSDGTGRCVNVSDPEYQYKSTCPSEIADCSRSNMCIDCANPLCEYCQNTASYVCGESDCMTCVDGYTLEVEWDDGTGSCVNQYESTCPFEITGCLITNMCTECANPLCEYCQNIRGYHCGQFNCMTCINGYTLIQEYSDGTGVCVKPTENPTLSSTGIPTIANTRAENENMFAIIVGCVVGGTVLILVCIAGSVFYILRTKKRNMNKGGELSGDDLELIDLEKKKTDTEYSEQELTDREGLLTPKDGETAHI